MGLSCIVTIACARRALADVENYEFELIRGLIVGGAICVPNRTVDLFIEWHTPRGPRADGSFHHMFNETEFGLPRLTAYDGMRSKSGENMDAFAVKDAMLWMLRSPTCRHVRTHRWW